jgi:hypothetical protein
VGNDDPNGSFHVELVGADPQEEGVPLPRRVIATTITPSDKFPNPDAQLGRRDRELTVVRPDERVYRYLGGKTRFDSISSRQRLSRVVDALVSAAWKSEQARMRMVDVFQLLGYQPQVEIEYDMRAGRAFRSRLKEVADDPDMVPGLYRQGRLGPIRWHRLQAYLRDERHVREFREALDFVDGVRRHRGALSVTVDLEHGSFPRGTRESFKHLQVLER